MLPIFNFRLNYITRCRINTLQQHLPVNIRGLPGMTPNRRAPLFVRGVNKHGNGLPNLRLIDLEHHFLLIAREFLVTGIRGLAESKGIDFRAMWTGKVKMMVQCAAVVGVLVYLALVYEIQNQAVLEFFRWARDIAIWATLIITIISAWQYISKAWRIIDA